MTDLPPGWAWATLGEIASTSLGKMLDRSRGTGRNLRPYLRNANVQWGRFDLNDVLSVDIPPDQEERYRLQSGDLLVCEGGEIGRCAVWRGGHGYMAYQKALHRVRPFGGIDSNFLQYWFKYMSLGGQLAPYSTGSTIKHLPQEQLRILPLRLPPLAEQRRIVAALDDHLSRVDKGCVLLSAVARRVDRFREQVMLLAATGRLGGRPAEATTAQPTPAGVADGDLPSLPSRWRWCRLEDVADVVGGVTKDSKRQSDPDLVEVPYLRVANVQRGFLDLSSVATIRVPANKADALQLQPGDVLLNEGGDRDKLGRGWVWEGQIEPCIHQNHVFRARVGDNLLHPKLLAWHANSFGRSWFQANGRQSVNLASISLSKVKQFPVPLPPIEEQAQLVSIAEQYLSLLDKLEAAVGAARVRAGKLRTSVLAEAFAGRLVEQDPSDEPASELLARIRADRAGAPARKRTRSPRTPRQAPAPSHSATAGSYQEEELPL